MLSQTNLSGGTLGAVGSIIGALYINPPVRTADYLASVKGFGLIKEARAQGVTGSGASVLSPIIYLWQVSRNISYVAMIIIFLVIGIMVMFRNKINPQTVITAQAALPGLIIGLILITFSYFLAGLISDMAFIGTNLVGYYFQSAQPGITPYNLVEKAAPENVLSIFSRMAGIITSDKVATFMSSIWDYLADPSQTGILKMDPQRVIQIITLMLTTQFILPFGSMFGGPGQILGGITALGLVLKDTTGLIGLSFSFIAIAILIYSMFKLLIKLINNYITIIFLTITAPFQFLAASLPGRQGIATGWVLNMLCNVLAFPAVMAVFYFAAFLLKKPYGPLEVSAAGNLAGNATFPLFGGMEMSFINLILAFGVLVASPTIPDIICRTIGRVSQAGQMIGQEISGSTGAGRGYIGRFQQGVGGFTGQVGRLTDQPGIQYIPDPDYVDPDTGARPGFRRITTRMPGQITRLGSGLRSLGQSIRNRF